MNYVYYQPVWIDKHFLYAGELAEMFGIYTTNGRPHAKLVAAYLAIRDLEDAVSPLFYETKHGLRRVYPRGEEYTKKLLEELKEQPDRKIALLNGKAYKFKLKEV